MKNKELDKIIKWKQTVSEKDLLDELECLSDEMLHDAFYRDLEFGTGGLRGIIGVGTNRLNVYTVSRATQGLSNYIHNSFKKEEWTVAIGRDSRINSDLFAETAACVFAANGIRTVIFDNAYPVPMLSYAIRHIHCCIGVMITASHNPSKYNGYKVYGSDGCQITTKEADKIYAFISKVDTLTGFKKTSFLEGIKQGLISNIPQETIDCYIKEIKKQSLLYGAKIDKNVSIVYSPLNGTGLKPITRALSEQGYSNVIIVKEQSELDGNFPTCPYPNPEVKEALLLGLEYCKKYKADLMLATDPDCDRVGIAVKNSNGDYELLSGNEVGTLLLDYICSRRMEAGTMPLHPVAIKTIVTTDLAEKIASFYGVKTTNVLTGFKFIGEQIGYLEKESRETDFIFGFEESCGYLTGTYVRDKDGVNGATMIAEMFAFYKHRGVSLLDKLQELWDRFGYCLNSLVSYDFPGEIGSKKMKSIMDYFRNMNLEIPGFIFNDKYDFIKGINGLPKSNVIRFVGDNVSVVVRPSGTEPKLKIYISLNDKNKEMAKIREKQLVDSLHKLVFCED